MFRYVVISVVKVTSKGHLEVKLLIDAQYATEDNIEK